MSPLRVRVPGSSANIGPGFDVLAIALAKYVEVSVEDAPAFEVVVQGYGAEIPSDANHLASRVLRAVRGDDHASVRISSDLPLARGLGSSAALALGVAAASGAPDPLSVAIAFEGHPENAAASMYGGAVAATMIESDPVVRMIPLAEELVGVLAIPELSLSTEHARSVLPAEYLRADAIFNLGRAVLLASSLGDISQITPALFEDRIHQQYRGVLFPEADRILEQMLSAGALGACWSGAGSTMMGFVHRTQAEVVRDAIRLFVDGWSVRVEVETVPFDRVGLVYLED
jgi:homoserine kinase